MSLYRCNTYFIDAGESGPVQLYMGNLATVQRGFSSPFRGAVAQRQHNTVDTYNDMLTRRMKFRGTALDFRGLGLFS